MNNSVRAIFCSALALAALLTTAARADGPLIVDPNARAGYHFSSDPIPVYYDLGNLGVVTDTSTSPPQQVVFNNAVGAQLVRNGYGSWSKVRQHRSAPTWRAISRRRVCPTSMKAMWG